MYNTWVKCATYLKCIKCCSFFLLMFFHFRLRFSGFFFSSWYLMIMMGKQSYFAKVEDNNARLMKVFLYLGHVPCTYFRDKCIFVMFSGTKKMYLSNAVENNVKAPARLTVISLSLSLFLSLSLSLLSHSLSSLLSLSHSISLSPSLSYYLHKECSLL